MFIILKNLPKIVNIDIIEYFIKPVLIKSILNEQGYINAIKLIGLRNKKSNVTNYFALIRLSSGKHEEKAVKYLNSNKFKKNILYIFEGFESMEASKFQIRCYSNDRRASKREDPDRRKFLELLPLDEKVFGNPTSKTWFEEKMKWNSDIEFILDSITRDRAYYSDLNKLPTDYVIEMAV